MLSRVRSHRSVAARDQRGAVVVTVALLAVALLLMAALAIDAGFARVTQREAQGSADAGALAAARELGDLPDATDARQQASTYAARNMTGPDVAVASRTCEPDEAVVAANGACYRAGDVRILVETPYVPQDADPEADYVRVRVCEPNPQFFSSVAGITMTSCAEAVAERRQVGNPFGTGIVVLNPPASCPGLTIQGDSDVSVTTEGAVYVNETCDQALRGVGNKFTLEAGYIQITGDYDGHLSDQRFPGVQPVTGRDPIPDPLGHLPEPPVPSVSGSCSGGKHRVCRPGRYASNQVFNGVDSVTLRPGIHYFEAGVDFKNAVVTVEADPTQPLPPETGNGVLIFLAGGSIDIGGNGLASVPPPETGTYEGISIFQGRSNTSLSKITGTTGTYFGTIYAPAGNLEVGGTSTWEIEGQLIADVIHMFGTMDLQLTPPDDLNPALEEEVINLFR